MKKMLTFITMLGWIFNSYSQEFDTHWISYPLPNDTSEVLFRQTFITSKRPEQASITIVSCGKTRVYVNERNITRNIYFQNQDSCHLISYTFDVTRFLRPDSNVIAVWYAPSKDMPISKQLSLQYYGIDDKGKRFYHQTDQEWLCHILQGCYVKNKNEEVFDNREYDHNWKATDYDTQGWLHPTGAYAHAPISSILSNAPPYQAPIQSECLIPIASSSDSTGVLKYDFGRAFEGSIRLTLRDATKGEKLYLDGFTYTCNGDLDEQAFRRFTSTRKNSILIKGDKNFKKSQLHYVEGLECTYIYHGLLSN